MKRHLTFLLCLAATTLFATAAPRIIEVKAPRNGADATEMLQRAIDRAAKTGGPVTIRLSPGIYNISADRSTILPYRVSNTAAESEHPTSNKHIGLHLKDISNLTIDGGDKATLLTHGEMSPWVMDNCANITFSGLTIDAYDPSVPEMTVTERGNDYIIARVHPDARYDIRSGRIYWKGCGWEFTDGIAQIHSPRKGTSLRCGSPVADCAGVSEIEPGLLRFNYPTGSPECQPGDTYQMRHSFRTEVAGLISSSSDITLKNCRFAFLGNFGIVSQMSADITVSGCSFAPLPDSGRTNAGFADFLQFSSCRGLLKIEDCDFAGSHDDPINIHGTHQRITSVRPDGITVRYMHNQTFGFLGFEPGDSIAFIDPATLLPLGKATITSTCITSEYDTDLSLADIKLDNPSTDLDGMIVENLTWCPAVEITRCSFTLTPTRGILVSTRRPVSITDCTFLNCPMSAILIADDGRSWYESGPVTDMTISGNRFINCANPVICIAPEAEPARGYVHSGIRIESNSFTMDRNPEIRAYSVNGLRVSSNTSDRPIDVNTTHCCSVISQ